MESSGVIPNFQRTKSSSSELHPSISETGWRHPRAPVDDNTSGRTRMSELRASRAEHACRACNVFSSWRLTLGTSSPGCS